jgi:hypothetical protein
MSQQWYYGQEGHKVGPCTAQQLRDLASAGKIILSDTIWKEGTDQGMLANRVKNLFPAPPGPSPSSTVALADSGPAVQEQPVAEGQAESSTSAPEQPVQEAAAETAPANTVTAPYQAGADKKPVKKPRAMAIIGAKIFGQDGMTVQFKKICTKCGHEDASRSTIKIRTGITRVPFYCPKCRKPRDVAIQGMA